MKNDAAVLRALQAVKTGEGESTFAQADVRTYRSLLRRQDPEYWQETGARKALRLFHAAASRVPAYKDFLKNQGVRPASVETIKDFSKLPILTKKNYIQKYSLSARSWDGSFRGHSLLAMSSGTSGKPTIWPRGAYQEAESAFIHEFLLTDLYEVDTYKTLMVVGFPMGIYVSGVATTVPSLLTAFKHPNLSVASVGNNKDSFLSIVQSMQNDYEQIILAGHPFFIKDVIETGKESGIIWSKLHVKTMCISEGFNETWRSYVAGLLRTDAAQSLFSAYGSSEFLLMGFENPCTIAIRQSAEQDATGCERIFGGSLVPSLFQYNPLSRFIETEGSDLVVTAASGIPLIRFNQHDMGTVIPYSTMLKRLETEKSPIEKVATPVWRPWRLPFVTLYGRSDRTLIFYAANIYPEHIQVALNNKKYLKKLTGKFFMEKKYLSTMDQYMEIHVELNTGITNEAPLAKELQEHIVRTLEKVNLEYLFLRQNFDKDLVPRVTLRQYQDPIYFKPGLKPRFLA